MKKLLLFTFAVAVLAGCKKDERVNPFDTNAIHLSPTTVRPGKAAEASLLTMESDPTGFAVYAWDGDGTGWWNGVSPKYHKYGADGAWNFDPAIEWPAIGSADYPLDFAAIFPSSALGDIVANETARSILFNHTVAADRDNQIDYLMGRNTATTKPTSGSLSMTFHHIMSKVNFGINVPVDDVANVQGVRINNIGNAGTYTLSIASPSWTTQPSTFTAGYNYYGQVLPSTGVAELPSPDIVGTGANSPFFNTSTTPTAANANLMLMPQNAPTRTWGGASAPTALPTTAESYIAVVYRMGDAARTTDIVGFDDAGDHPDFTGSTLESSGYSDVDPLFVKVGYPFVLEWDQGKGYTYNIALDNTTGTNTGGYLIDDFYYDKYGNPTDLRVDAVVPGATIPDPIYGDGNIHLIPDVQDWDEQPAGNL